jgi:hypothetical protein
VLRLRSRPLSPQLVVTRDGPWTLQQEHAATERSRWGHTPITQLSVLTHLPLCHSVTSPLAVICPHIMFATSARSTLQLLYMSLP